MRRLVEAVVIIETKETVVVRNANHQASAGAKESDAFLNERLRVNYMFQHLERSNDVVWYCGSVLLQKSFMDSEALAGGDLRRFSIHFDTGCGRSLVSHLAQEIPFSAADVQDVVASPNVRQSRLVFPLVFFVIPRELFQAAIKGLITRN